MYRITALLFFLTFNAYSKTIFTIGVEAIDYSPIFSSTIGPRNFEGYSREVFDRFAKLEGIEFQYVPLPIKRFVSEFYSGRLDFAFPDNPQWHQDKIKKGINYSRPVIIFQDAIYVRPKDLGKGLKNLKALGTLLGFSVWKFKANIDAGTMILESATTPEGLINMALLNRVDGINLAGPVVSYYLKKMKKPNALVIDPDLIPIKNSYYLLSTFKHPLIIKKFNNFLIKDAAYLRSLRQRFGL